ITLSTGPWWCAPVLALGWITTVPAQSFSAPARAWVIAAARFMPGVCAVLMSSSFECTTRTPSNFHLAPGLLMGELCPASLTRIASPAVQGGKEATPMTRLALAVAAAFVVLEAQAQDAGRITRVMLYPGSATVERSAPVVLGQTRLELTGLPANFDPRTLRVEADSGIRVGEIAVRDLARTESASPRESQLEARIQALKDQLGALDVEAKSAELVRDFLASLHNRPEGDKPKPLDPKAIPGVLDAIKRGGGDAFGTIHRVSLKKTQI